MAKNQSNTPNYATNLAVVNPEGVIENIIWGMFYGFENYAPPGYTVAVVDELCVKIGDTYEDGKFYNQDGEVVKSVTQVFEEEIEALDNFIIEALYEDIINDLDEFEE